jgi:hypothetical protein
MADRFGSDAVERALAMQEGSVLANEVLRLRNESPYFTCRCGQQVHVPALVEFAELRAMRERAEFVKQGGQPIPLVSVSAGPQARNAIARYILGETR